MTHRIRPAGGVVIVCVMATLLGLTAPAAAGPANPTPFEVVQPDGATFLVRAVGDEWSNAHHTLDGYAVVRNEASGFWVYADKDASGALVPTPLIVTRDQPGALSRGLLPEAAVSFDAGVLSVVNPEAVVGSRPVLLILVQFTNRTALTTAAAWQSRFFGPTSSVNHHYSVSSYGNSPLLTAAEVHGTVNDGVVGWLTLPYTHPNTAGSTDTRNQQLAKDAVLAADPFVNFGVFDTNGDTVLTPAELSIVVIAAGNETSFGGASGSCSPSVWGHVWSIQAVTPPIVDGKRTASYGQFGEMHCGVSSPPGQMATIGIMAHELGHLYGIPDLYDADGSSEGVGEWSLMGSGSWNGVTRAGDSPSLMDPWSKARLGWVNPTMVSGMLVNQSIAASATSPAIFQFRTGNAQTGTGEYFLIENRQRVSYDTSLPGAGLLIWHVEESRPDNRSECAPGGALGLPACSATVHYKLAVVQADNQYHLEIGGINRSDPGDPYPGTSVNRNFTDSSLPHSRLWNGTASGISITNITLAANIITATLSDGTAPATFTLSLTIRGSGNGSVLASPGGISCLQGTCLTNWVANTPVLLTAVPAAGAVLKLWTGSCTGALLTCTVTMSQARSVTATFAAVFTDATLPGTFVKAAHVLELRTAIGILRGRYGLAAFSWTDPSLAAGSPVRAVHFIDLRTALTQTYAAAGITAPVFTDATLAPGVTPLRATHVSELRSAVAGLE